MQTFSVPAEGRQAAAQRIAAFIESALPGKPLRVTVEKAKRQRSDPQNNYLFGVAYPLLVEAKGYEVNDIHEFMCGTHFGWVDKPCPKTPRNPEGLESKPFRSTTRDETGKRNVLGTVEFSEFVETVKRVAAQAGIYIPDPNE
jgi:hypothetical protein